MRKLALAGVAAAVALTVGGGEAYAATPPTLVVDDDGVQCARAQFTSIQAAVDAAQPGYLIRVCPGRYSENVTVDKPLTLNGNPDAVDALDCFSPTQPAADPTTQTIVEEPPDPTTDAPAAGFDLEADDIDLQGFVLLGRAGSTSQAVVTSVGHSGYRVHHNLIVAHRVGAYFRSIGALPSSFDHNCLRDDGWGLANQWLPLIDARIHHNSTFNITNFAYEQTGNCPEFLETGLLDACAETRIGMDDVVFDHNVSIADDVAFRLASSRSTMLFDNTVTHARIGIRLMGANEDLQVIGNRFDVRQAGLARQSNPPIAPNLGALIQANTVTGSGTSAGIGMGGGGLKNSEVLDNVISGLDGEGIALLAGNTGNVVRGNSVTDNGRDGIRVAAGATGNTFEANEMLGNGRIDPTVFVDARDSARDFNVWRGNVCLTDIPDGTICGVQ